MTGRTMSVRPTATDGMTLFTRVAVMPPLSVLTTPMLAAFPVLMFRKASVVVAARSNGPTKTSSSRDLSRQQCSISLRNAARVTGARAGLFIAQLTSG
jgi:hypothetical protein